MTDELAVERCQKNPLRKEDHYLNVMKKMDEIEEHNIGECVFIFDLFQIICSYDLFT